MNIFEIIFSLFILLSFLIFLIRIPLNIRKRIKEIEKNR